MTTPIKKIPAGYKQTVLGVIPEDWDVKRLDDIFLITAGRDLIKDSYSQISDGDHSFPIYSNSLESKGLYGYTKIPRHKENSITITARGTIGKANARDHKFDAIGRLLILEPVKKLDCFFISEYVNNRVVFSIESTGVPQLTAPQASKYLIAYPAPKEQTVIATVLSDTDALIERLEKLIAKKKAIKQGAMQQLLTGKKRLPGFYEVWEVKKLGDIAIIKRGASPRPINSPIWFDKKSIIGWVRISDVTKSTKLLKFTVQNLSALGIKHSRFVGKGNLIMSICATVGRPILTDLDVCIHDGFVVYTELKIEKEFLYYILSFIEDDWSKNGQTGSQMNLNTSLINLKQIAFPKSKPEQTAIAKILSDMDAEIESLEQKQDKYKMLKQGMMQLLLTGKIRINAKN